MSYLILLLASVALSGYVGYRIGRKEGEIKGMVNMAADTVGLLEKHLRNREGKVLPSDEDFVKNVHENHRAELELDDGEKPSEEQVKLFTDRVKKVMGGGTNGYVIIGMVENARDNERGREVQMGGGVYIHGVNRALLLSGLMASLRVTPTDFKRVSEMSEISSAPTPKPIIRKKKKE